MCNAGYTGTNPCTACVMGKYKSSVGSHGCSNCGSLQWNYAPAASSVDSCVCASGTFGAPPAVQCVVCPIGTYKVGGGNADSCTTCPVQSTTTETQSNELTDCVCNAGYTGYPGGPCSICPANSYSSANSWTAADCLCNTGYGSSLPTGSCVACASGTYKVDTDYNTNAICYADRYWDMKTASGTNVAGLIQHWRQYGYNENRIFGCACTACPMLPSISPTGSTAQSACVCNTGYTASTAGRINLARSCGTGGDACSAVQSSTAYSGIASRGNDGSTNGGYWSSSHCTHTSDSGTNAWWRVDFGREVDVYQVDIVGRRDHQTRTEGYTITVGNTASTTIHANNGVCVANQPALLGSGQVTTIICRPTRRGRYLQFHNPRVFTLCEVWVYGPPICDACSPGKYNAIAGSGTCTDCPVNSVSPAGSGANTACLCSPGFTVSEQQCAVEGATCVCSGSMRFGRDTRWTAPQMVSGSIVCDYRILGDPAPGATKTCRCTSDFGTCTACAVGTYKTATGTATCTDCPVNMNSPAGSTSANACRCNAGYTGPDGGPCSACGAGTFKASPGSAACGSCATGTYSSTAASTVCQGCPSFSNSPAGSSAADQCICYQGYTNSIS
jgi:hypothetical protein